MFWLGLGIGLIAGFAVCVGLIVYLAKHFQKEK
jgi:hypothetical protein